MEILEMVPERTSPVKMLSQKETILRLLQFFDAGKTSSDIENCLGFKKSSVSARLTELLVENKIFISKIENRGQIKIRHYSYNINPDDKPLNKLSGFQLLRRVIDSLYPEESKLIYDEFYRLKNYNLPSKR